MFLFISLVRLCFVCVSVCMQKHFIVSKCILGMFGLCAPVCVEGSEWVSLQQVDAAVVQQVGGALGGLFQHLVLVDDLNCLVVDAQPAVKTNVEDISGVMAACRAVSMVINNWNQDKER